MSVGASGLGRLSQSTAVRHRGATRTALMRVGLDLVVWTACTPVAAFLADTGTALTGRNLDLAVFILLATKLATEIGAGVYQRVWSRFGFLDAWRGIWWVMAGESGWIAVGILLELPAVDLVRASVTELGLAWGALLGMRVLRRYLVASEHAATKVTAEPSRILVVGAGEAGTLVVHELLQHPELGLVPVGFVDDDPRKIGSTVSGIPVLGPVADAGKFCGDYGIDEVLTAVPSENGSFVRHVRKILDEAPVSVRLKTMPGLYELLSGKVSVSRLREVRAEDLLRRAPVGLDEARVQATVEGKRVLITGAGGSIGSELARQVCRHRPAVVLLLGRGEHSIFTISKELAGRFPDVQQVRIIADVRNRNRLMRIVAQHRPDILFHAAAHKHVGLMEENPEAAVLNNVLGTRNVVDAVLAHDVTSLVNISTDKAVRPTSVMGATKRTAELIVRAGAAQAVEGQTLVSVRFGNVLGSRGSVVPLFLEQIRSGGSVRVTHPDMKRYFMTIPEASQLVLQAGAIAQNGAVYILDMGDPVKIVDLASDLIRLSGLEPKVDVDIEFIGARPGEKLFEELISQEERNLTTSHEKIVMSRMPDAAPRDVGGMVQELAAAALEGDVAQLRSLLCLRVDGIGVG